MQRLIAAIMGLLLSPTISFALSKNLEDTMRKTFGWGGIGSVIVVLLVLAVGSSIAEHVSGAFGKGYYSTIIKIISTFLAIIIFVGVALKLLDSISKIFM